MENRKRKATIIFEDGHQHYSKKTGILLEISQGFIRFKTNKTELIPVSRTYRIELEGDAE